VTISHLPIFPLSLIAFEGEIVRLHIFEPRYKKLVEDCLNDDSCFGIPVVLNGQMLNAGTEMKIRRVVNKYPNGNLDIECMALRRFEVREFFPSRQSEDYSNAMVEYLPYIENEDKELRLRILDLIAELYQVSKTKTGVRPLESDDFIKWVHKCGLSLTQEIEIATLQNVQDRQLYLLAHLKTMLAAAIELDTMRQRIEMNGHFRILPQSF
jgi:Lon protease-like protein